MPIWEVKTEIPVEYTLKIAMLGSQPVGRWGLAAKCRMVGLERRHRCEIG